MVAFLHQNPQDAPSTTASSFPSSCASSTQMAVRSPTSHLLDAPMRFPAGFYTFPFVLSSGLQIEPVGMVSSSSFRIRLQYSEHEGLVEKGMHVRAAYSKEAYALIHSMSIEPYAATLGSTLGPCKDGSWDLELDEQVPEEFVALELKNCKTYVIGRPEVDELR